MSVYANQAKYSGTGNTNIFSIRDAKDFGLRMAARVREVAQIGNGTAFALHYANVGVAYTHLYGLDVEGVGANAAVVTRSGDQGSIAELRIPAAAGQLRKVWNIIVGPELSWTAVATTTDFASEAEAITAKNALQYYWADRGVSTKAKGQAFEALSFAEAALHIPWNEDLGDDIAPEPILDEQGQPVMDDEGQPTFRILKTGDIDYRVISTWDIIRDPTAKSYEALKWVAVREWQDKFDVAAMCKDRDTANAALQSNFQPQETYRFWRPFNSTNSVPSNFIPVYYLYHMKTPSVPQGRQTVFLDNGAIISDEPLDKAYWELLPVVRIAVGEYSGTPFPYSKWFSTLGSQQASDSLARDLVTNATATSGGLIWAEDDADTPVPQLGGGPKVIVGAKGSKPPVPLMLQQSHPEHFNLRKTLMADMLQMMGLDRLTSGEDVGANLSGAAMALMASTSVQNNSQEQSVWGKFVQDIGNVTLAHIQCHMTEPRRIALAGNARAGLVKSTELSGDKVKGVDRIQVQLAPALQQTDAGKLQMAEMAIKEKWVRTPEEAQQVLDTGRLDALTQGLSNELMLVSAENEALSRGEDVPVMANDNHRLHLSIDGGHPTVTASLTARRNKPTVDAVTKHMGQHIEFLQKTDPKILEMFGQPSLAQPPQAGPPPMADATKLGMTNLAVKAGWAPTPQAAEQVFKSGDLTAAQTAADPQAAANPAPGTGAPPQMAQHAKGPSMPLNPVTNQPAAPVAGVRPPGLAVKPS
jgi:hypothetical protein